MYLYASSLRRASFLMVNSSWTKNHVDSILQHNDFLLGSVLSVFFLFSPFTFLGLFGTRTTPPKSADIVYPPCETQELVDFQLEQRERVIVSVAQFR